MENAEEKIVRLERELDEVTEALAQAWDQLVPFLDTKPALNNGTDAMLVLLDSARTALDVPVASIYELANHRSTSLPADVHIPERLYSDLAEQMTPYERLYPSEVWLIAPILVEGKVVGALSVMRNNTSTAYKAVDVRMLARMSETVANQILSDKLAQSRQREAQAAQELEIAAHIQCSIQPRKMPQSPSLQVASSWRPARRVGGDAWGWQSQANGKLAFFLLDVSGKGLPASLAAVSLHSAIKMAIRLNYTPQAVLESVNAEFYDVYTETSLFATATVFTIDPQTGILEQANAGHPPSLLRVGGKWMNLPATAPPLGVLESLDIQTQRLQLEDGDLMILYSDGFSEIETRAGLWGEEGIQAIIPAGARNPQGLTRLIVGAADRLRAGHPPHDDQTLLVLSYSSQGGKSYEHL